MIQITHSIAINENEIRMEFVRSSGPGGQNVNKVATAVQLRFNVRKSPSLPDDVRDRLVTLAGKRITENGVLIIEAKRFRTQERNRMDAITRLVDLVRLAAVKPKSRKKTKPTFASKQRRIDAKRLHGKAKRKRRSNSHGEDL